MSVPTVLIHELIAWGVDEYPYRNSSTGFSNEDFAERLERTAQSLAVQECYEPRNAFLEEESERIEQQLDAHMQRAELRQEYEGLDWTIGVVDLRCLLAFQRRLVFDPESSPIQLPQQEDWSALLSLSFGPARDTNYRMTLRENIENSSEFLLQSSNPDLQLRPVPDACREGLFPFALYGGSPFFEVAAFRERWFLRDGYHRAYGLLQAGVHSVPAVIIRARTIEELGATQPWFFSEDQLFSARPPRVKDFLDDGFVYRYQRPQFTKTIRIQIEESLQPFDAADEVQGDGV